MTQYPRTVEAFLNLTGHADSDETRGNVQHVLDLGRVSGWMRDTDAANVIALGAALWNEPPTAATALDPVQALSLVSQMFCAEIVPGDHDPADTPELARRVRAKVTALAREGEPAAPYNDMRQQAARAAVRQLGGARRVDIPEWMELALGDVENWTACDDVIEHVELACRNTAPGRLWRYVHALGFVTYEIP